MKTEDWDRLLEKYFDGKTTREEENKLRDHYAGQDEDDPSNEIAGLFHSYNELKQLAAPDDFWDKTDALLPENETVVNPGAVISRMNGWRLFSRIAAVLLLTAGGFFAGTWYANSKKVTGNTTNASLLAAKFEQAS
ncbi:MAG TPA: hypothetical protein VKA08_08440, partial [Balneolales bacterium]|nr:hypothetical protein [Balneolales bacterium]